MRFLSALVFSLFISSHAMAAMTADTWKSQLQEQIQQLQAQSPSIKATGEVTVQEAAGGQIVASLPILTVTSPDRSTWSIPPIQIQATSATNNIVIKLPATVTRYDAGKKEIARMNIGAQALNARWNESAHTFESLNGIVRNITFNDTIANAKSSVGNVTITANKGAPVEFIATDIRNTTVQKDETVNMAITKASITYQIPAADSMSLPRLIGYFNPAILLSENREIVFTVSAEQLGITNGTGHLTTLQKLNTKFDLQPKGQSISGVLDAQAYIINQTPASPYGFALPRQAELIANITNVPVEMVSFAPGMSLKMARKALDQAGTVIDITKLNIVTFDNAKLSGTGHLKADNETPSGFAGRINIKIENLKDMIAANQLQLLQPDNGTNRSGRTQGLMAMMMLQGMGKQNGTDTEFALDLTADGQTLVNGQDLSGLIGSKSKAKSIDTVPAIPLTPVKSSNL
jgi:hypothetical protein